MQLVYQKGEKTKPNNVLLLVEFVLVLVKKLKSLVHLQ